MLNRTQRTMPMTGSILAAFCLLASVVASADTTVLVTGANRGLGLEFVRQYAERGYTVVATARRPEAATDLRELQANNDSIIIEKLDVTDLEAIEKLAEKFRSTPIDILVNNAGITGDPYETQVFGKIDYTAFDPVMHVNVLGPLKMTEAFVDHVAASREKKIITVSSSMGSITKTFGLSYFYRSSKAALNMVMVSLARDPTVGLKKKGIIIGMVNPGPTDTDMMAPVRGQLKLRDPAEATADMIRNIDGMTLADTGIFLEYDGEVIPW